MDHLNAAAGTILQDANGQVPPTDTAIPHYMNPDPNHSILLTCAKSHKDGIYPWPDKYRNPTWDTDSSLAPPLPPER